MLMLKVLEPLDQSWQQRRSRGGNKTRPTFAICPACKCFFGPLPNKMRKYCSMECKARAQATGRRIHRRATPAARKAQGLVRSQLRVGLLERPKTCEECGKAGKRIEAAHYDYEQPLEVRWLCRSCHVRWDKKDPKNGTYVVTPPNAARRDAMSIGGEGTV